MPQGINDHDNNNRCFCFSLFQNKTTSRRVRWQVRRTDITPVWQFCRRLPNAARQHVTLIRICVLNWKSGPEQGQRKEEKQRKWKKETKKERKGELKKKRVENQTDSLLVLMTRTSSDVIHITHYHTSSTCATNVTLIQCTGCSRARLVSNVSEDRHHSIIIAQTVGCFG